MLMRTIITRTVAQDESIDDSTTIAMTSMREKREIRGYRRASPIIVLALLQKDARVVMSLKGTQQDMKSITESPGGSIVTIKPQVFSSPLIAT